MTKMVTPVELKQDTLPKDLQSRTIVKGPVDPVWVSAATPAPRKLSATLIGAVLGASLMASPAAAQTVERECKTDRWTVEQYPVQVCPPQGNNYLRGGSYGG
jgi:hypothetical protein